VDLLDVVIILLVIGALASGWRRGITWVGLSLLGLLVGVVVGALVAPPLARAVAGHDLQHQAFIGAGIFLTAVALVEGVGTAVGYQVRVVALRTRFAHVDSGLGSALAGVGVLLAAWYLGLTFAQSPFPRLDLQIRDSAILRRLDAIAPRPPAFLAALEHLLKGSSFPNPFAGLAPITLSPVEVPPSADTPGIKAAVNSVAKVLSTSASCGGIEAGSSWPVSKRDYLVTNAHVVAGGQDIVVETPDGSRKRATVVLFDSDVDIAVLYVPGLDLTPLTTAASDPGRGVQGAVIGYPGGRDEAVAAGAVRGTEQAQGRDIYGTGLVTRTIEVLQGTPPPGENTFVIPGDSGGPMVDRNGVVIGLVFAASTVDPNEGYALSISQISDDIAKGEARTTPVSTGDCSS